MCGLGGIFVELFRDVQLRIAPVDSVTAEAMVRGIQAAGILTGSRGRTPRDTAAVAGCLAALSRLALDCPQIAELDINPLIVMEAGQGCFVADAKIMM
jgi:acyl-CoA synthetase (NDP forming)